MVELFSFISTKVFSLGKQKSIALILQTKGSKKLFTRPLDEYKKLQLSDCSFENFKIYEYMSVPFGANLYEIISSVSNRDMDKIEDILKWGRTNFDILKKQSIQPKRAKILEQTI